MIVTLLRTVVLYILVIIGLRIMGKRQIGDMQPNELVATILISELATIPIQDVKQPVLNGAVAIFVLVCLEVIMTAVALKSDKLRRAVDGKPSIVIRHGDIDRAAMKSLRLTVDDLLSNLRENQVFRLSDVEYAIIETDGQMSVMLTPEAQPLTAGQAKKASADGGMPIPVICDGKLRDEFMKSVGMDKTKLDSILKNRKIKLSDVFLMTVDSQGKIDLVTKEGR